MDSNPDRETPSLGLVRGLSGPLSQVAPHLRLILQGNGLTSGTFLQKAQPFGVTGGARASAPTDLAKQDFLFNAAQVS